MEVAVAVEGVQKRYGDVEALKGIDLSIQTGELVAILGPNGAGKSTAPCSSASSRRTGAHAAAAG